MGLLVFLTATVALWAQEPNIQGPNIDELLILEGTPKSGVKPANDHEKQLLVSRLKRWIDKEEFFESGLEVEVTGAGGDARPGSIIGMKHQRMEDGTWLMEEMHIRFIFKPLRIGDRRMESVITRSDFHKFAVDSRIVEVQ